MQRKWRGWPVGFIQPDSAFVARELAPAGARSGPRYSFSINVHSGFMTASQPSGSKLPRHRGDQA
ncbi:hypothetical protein FCH79_19470 [Pseudomonas koreensis]|nr:hypothetical protein [Pseudomonas koreensis]